MIKQVRIVENAGYSYDHQFEFESNKTPTNCQNRMLKMCIIPCNTQTAGLSVPYTSKAHEECKFMIFLS